MDVKHDEGKKRFEIDLGGKRALLDYEVSGNAARFTHTEVPREMEGKGIGALLAKAGLEWARDKGYKIIPQCAFIAAYVRRHPEWQSHLLSSSE